ncbi:MAG TPA: diacylglycerol kinase family protein, partial [Gemmatimonadaceae bacterium]|nr:diacylglycerol kinase family protein [Gemmatimonadaceae bacterium]
MSGRIPAIVNVASGTAEEARKVLEEGDAFEVHAVEPDAIASTIREVVKDGATRVLVSGGDGTIATAAAELLETPAELAILPGGTLNHFARDLGVSTEAAEALRLAVEGKCRGVDIGVVNGHVFLNTSSVGAYVRFVRVRERLEKRFPYRIASALAALRILFQLRTFAVEVEVEGQPRIYRTPLVFIGVGERELQLPTLGSRIAGGQRGLHVMVVRSRTRARLLAIALAAVAKGVDAVARTPQLDSFLVDRCRIKLRRPTAVAIDGELEAMHTTLEFELRRDALHVVC